MAHTCVCVYNRSKRSNATGVVKILFRAHTHTQTRVCAQSLKALKRDMGDPVTRKLMFRDARTKCRFTWRSHIFLFGRFAAE